MTKAQVTLEFMFSFLFYILFLSLLISSVHYYTLTVQEKLENTKTLLILEETARIFDSFYAFDSHFSLELGQDFILKEGLIYDSENSIAIETIYEDGGLDGEAA